MLSRHTPLAPLATEAMLLGLDDVSAKALSDDRLVTGQFGGRPEQ
jgi:hypothetical protein